MTETVKIGQEIHPTNIELIGAAQLREILNGIPSLHIISVTPEVSLPGWRADFEIQIRVGDIPFALFLEVKPQKEPRDLRSTIAQLASSKREYLRQSEQNPERVAVILAATYISPEIAQACCEAGIGYLDAAGNAHIAFGTVYIHREGRPNPLPRDPALRTLFSPKAERVLRVLLAAPNRPWKTIPLAEEAAVSIGQIDKVKKALLAQEFIEAKGEGIICTKPNELLDLWAKNYSVRRGERLGATYHFYTLLSTTEIEQNITRFIDLKDAIFQPSNFALSGISASKFLAPYVNSPRITANIITGIQDFASKMEMIIVDTGSNFVLTVPYDSSVLYGAKVINNIPVVSPVQAYLDLYRIGGRSREAAAHLKDEVLLKSWNQKSL